MGYKLQKQYRFQNYDYSFNGYYFVTVCTKNRENFFGEIQNQEMNLSRLGRIVDKYWQDISNHYSYVRLDEYIIMPNHLHGIVIIDRGCRGGGNGQSGRNGIYSVPTGLIKSAPTDLLPNDPYDKDKRVVNKISELQPQKKSLSIILRVFKAAVTKWFRKNDLPACRSLGVEREYDIWQSRFHDRIIRDEEELECIREYIRDNPSNWDEDRNNQDE